MGGVLPRVNQRWLRKAEQGPALLLLACSAWRWFHPSSYFSPARGALPPSLPAQTHVPTVRGNAERRAGISNEMVQFANSLRGHGELHHTNIAFFTDLPIVLFCGERPRALGVATTRKTRLVKSRWVSWPCLSPRRFALTVSITTKHE